MSAKEEPRPVWKDTLKGALAGLERDQRRRVPRLASELRALLDRANLLDCGGADVYDFLVDGMLLRLVRGATAEDLGSWMQAELATVGGGDTDPARTQGLAAVIHVWFAASLSEEGEGSRRL